MLTLDNPLVLDQAAIDSPNLCDRFTENDLKRIGTECATGYEHDVLSRATWMRRNEAGMDLALQVQKSKNFPWANCSNVAFPLITIAGMQFHARAYPALVPGSDIVKCAVSSSDPTGALTTRADRISTDMSWQVLHKDKSWEEQEDKLLFNTAIIGTAFKKSYHIASLKKNVSELVMAKDLVLDYWTKSVEECPRKTHHIPMSRNEVYEKVLRGTFRDVLEDAWYKSPSQPRTNEQQTREDKRTGVIPPPVDTTTSLLLGEQHVNLDLDDDGYAEPYIITFDLTSHEVLRIVVRFNSEKDIERVQRGPRRGKIICIEALEYFTKRPFIPSPDGGIYDIGFGVLLGPMNESVNTLVNQLIDAGTMQTTGGGFLGRGAKVRGGTYTFAPFEWKRVDSSGDDLRKSIYQLPVNAPSDVLFRLLALLIDYTNRIAGTTDTMVGENPGQNTPAETTRTMVEMGQKIYAAIFKRQWRGLGAEFQKLYKLNAMYLPLDYRGVGGATKDDYLGSADDICPVADPNVTSDTLQLQLATALKQAAMTTPGYDRDAVERRYLKALKVDAIDQVFPGTKGAPPPEDVKIQLQKMKNESDALDLEWQKQKFTMELMETRQLNGAKITELMAKAQEASANAQNEASYAQVAQINAQISVIQSENKRLDSQIDAILRAKALHLKEKELNQPQPRKAA